MKAIARSIAFNAFSLFFLTQIFSGIRILGGLPALLVSAAALSVLSFILKPILSAITFPLHAITFGTFTIVINAVILYTLTLIVKQVHIHAFLWPGISFAGFVVPKFEFNVFGAFLVIALMQTIIKIGLIWLTKS